MGLIKVLFSLTIIFIIKNVDSQSILSGIPGLQNLPGIDGLRLPGSQGARGLDRQLPIIGACDRIASRGVANCMENFLPQRLLSGFTNGRSNGQSTRSICCNYSKYKACISGLHDGLRLAMERERCPKSYSTRIIKSFGDSFIGIPMKTFCETGEGRGSKCPKGNGTTRKKTKKPQRNNPEESPSIQEPAIQPFRDGLDQFTNNRRPSRKNTPEENAPGSPLDPVIKPFRDVFGSFNNNRRPSRNNAPEGESTSPLDPVIKPFRDIFGSFTNNGRASRNNAPEGESTSPLDPVIKPFRDVLGSFTNNRRTSRNNAPEEDSRSPLDPVIKPFSDIFGQFTNNRNY